MKIKEFGRNEHRILAAAIETALKAVGDEFGVDLTQAGGQYGSSGHVKIAVRVRDTGAGKSGAQSLFESYAPMFGIPASMFGQVIYHRGVGYKIAGIAPNRRTNVFEITRVHDGKALVCAKDMILPHVPMKKVA